MAIIIKQNGEDVTKVNKSAFETEDDIQRLIFENPESIPLYDIKEDIKFLTLIRELPTNSGPIDAIGIDQDGEIYIVETKLYKNPDKRKVVAQALDYGAALWKHANNFEEFTATIDRNSKKMFNMSLAEKLNDFFGEDTDADAILNAMRHNLNEGLFRFVVLMDELDDRLKDLILYVNQNSKFDIYAVQLERYEYGDMEIVIPRLFGAQVKKDISVARSNSPRRRWTEEEMFADAEKSLDKKTYVAFKKIYEFSKEKADGIKLGSGMTKASFGPVFTSVCSRTLFTLSSDGVLSPNFGWLNDTSEEVAFRDAFFAFLKDAGFPLTDEDLVRYPSFDPDEWVPRADTFLTALTKSLK